MKIGLQQESEATVQKSSDTSKAISININLINCSKLSLGQKLRSDILYGVIKTRWIVTLKTKLNTLRSSHNYYFMTFKQCNCVPSVTSNSSGILNSVCKQGIDQPVFYIYSMKFDLMVFLKLAISLLI